LRAIARLARQGNDETLGAVAQHPELVPVATVDPRQYPECREEVARCVSRGVRLFRLFPREQGWSIDSEPFVQIVRQLRGHGAVLILSAGEWGLASAIGRLTAGHDLTVVLSDTHYTQMGETLAALQSWPHLYALTNRLATVGAVELMVREVGSERVLFGSDTPTRPLQCALNAVWFANISDSQRSAIFSGNADRLIGRSSRAEESNAEPPPLPAFPIVDVHAHVGRFPYPHPEPRSADDEVERLDRNRRTFNLAEVFASSIDAIAYDLEEGNARIAELLGRYSWLRGYAVVNPRHLGPSIAALDACYARDRFVGAKVHAEYAATPTNSRRMWQLFEEIAQRGRPVKIHNAGMDWQEALRHLARSWPRLKVVIAHAGLGVPSDEAIELAASEANVYLEFCTTYPTRGIVRAAIERAGVEKVLFGSDQPLIDPAYVLGIYQDANLSQAEWAHIVQSNPHEVFDF
jgi:predicted TIM-barrel fold metal-dependent hydrolase